ncbi:hypothetical protein QFC20_002827 [Naganishia adeliensis]|uniref:Uncharacterized protein n=1 Tax=Naganishia adeliensis TaxID=92952 RepID=A0ACC2WIX8_9TREE|nr:hypothetical protein QFC20_002827 [Naganishia adeliensis]
MAGYADPYQYQESRDGQHPAMHPDSTYPPARPGPKHAAGDSYSTYSDKPRVSISEGDNRRSALPKTAPRGSRYFTGEHGNTQRPMSQWTVGIEPPPKSTGMLRMWRKENRAGWVEGGGWRAFARMFSCCFLSFLFVVISVILTLLMWVRPPDINLNGVTMPTNALQVNAANQSLNINFDLAISATNPNWFSAKFQEISAVFPANTLTNVTFPFALQYTSAMDPDGTVIADIISKCTNKQQIKINYDLTLKIHIVAVTIAPKISSSAMIDCPVDDLSALTGLGGRTG